MATELDTVPAARDVTTDSADTWAIDFAAALREGEAIASAGAALYTDMPGDAGAEVAGFVLAATPNGTTVEVEWTGAPLSRHSVYQLQTRAVLDSGAAIEVLTTVRCVG